jgi:ankyrin repeat protein
MYDDVLQGWTPLLVSAREGHIKVVECLLRAGADIEAKDKKVKQTVR